MSKSVRAAIAVSILLIFLSVAFAFLMFSQKQSLSQLNTQLQNEIAEYQNKQTELLAKTKTLEQTAEDLNKKLTEKESERAKAERLYEELKSKADDLNAQIEQAQSERDDWKNRVETMRRERDGLMEKLKNRPKEIVYRDKPAEGTEGAPAAVAAPAAAPVAAAPAAVPAVTGAQGDEYWAGVLKQKAALQLEIEKARSDLDKTALQVGELKKQNSDLQLSLKQITNEKEELEHKYQKDTQEYQRKIKYGEDLATNLSIELARARNDQKFVNDRADKIKEETLDLQSQIKQLSSTKVILEKTISRLTDEKESIQKKLLETENIIQGRIDEIWKIKESVDKKLAESPVKPQSQMELPPIIVNVSSKNGQAVSTADAAPAAKSEAPVADTAKKGSIISLNETNNFVITDLGQDSGIKVGQILTAHRGNKEIATLQVIQVRKDICAADIKQKSDAIKVGDAIRVAN